MQKVWVQLGGVTAIAALTLLGTASLVAAQNAGATIAVEELDKRSKPEGEATAGQNERPLRERHVKPRAIDHA